MLPRDKNPDGPGESGTAPALAPPALALRTNCRLGLGTRDKAWAAPGTNFSFIPGTEEEEEPGCTQSILCRPQVPGHHCLPLPDPCAVGDGDVSPRAVRWHLLAHGSSVVRAVSARGTSGQKQGQAEQGPKGHPGDTIMHPLPTGLWMERGHGSSQVGGGSPGAPQPCWKGDSSHLGRVDELGTSFGGPSSSCPWASLATVHRLESCPMHPARASGWPDSAPQVRAAGACVCVSVCVCVRRGEWLHPPPDEDAQEGGEQCPAVCWQRDAVPGVSLLCQHVHVQPGTAQPSLQPGPLLPLLLCSPSWLGTGCWRRGADPACL